MHAALFVSAAAASLLVCAVGRAQITFNSANFTGTAFGDGSHTMSGRPLVFSGDPANFVVAGRSGGGQTGGGLVDGIAGPTIGTSSASVNFSISALAGGGDNVVVTASASGSFSDSVNYSGSIGAAVSTSDPVRVRNDALGAARSYLMTGNGIFRASNGLAGTLAPGGTFVLPATGSFLFNYTTAAPLVQGVSGRLEARVIPYVACAESPTWRSIPTGAGGPSPRVFASGVYDEANAKLVVFGGFTGGAPATSDETWVWNGASWSQLAGPRPPRRFSPAMAYGNGSIVLFGGLAPGASQGQYTPLNDTWVLNLGATTPAWVLRNPAQRPAIRYGHKMAYDKAASRFVVFGGDQQVFPSRLYLNDTWSWNGSNWTLVAAGGLPGRPTPRKDFSMTYDSANSRVVLFGGTTGAPGSTYQSDTWLLTGAAWTQVLPATVPPARDNHAMTFDTENNRVVMHGGSGSGEQNTTWTWNGSNWTRRDTPGPSSWIGSVLAYSPLHRSAILFGGQAAGNGPYQNGVWSYGGTPPQFTQQPANRVLAPLGTTIQFNAPVSNPTGVAFRWFKNNEAVFDGGRISGASTSTLVISGSNTGDAGRYYLLAMSNCNASFTRAAVAGCPADVDDGSGTGIPDGGITIDDLLYYLGRFDDGAPNADVDDGSGTWTLDGGVTIEDLLYYLQRFDAGC